MARFRGTVQGGRGLASRLGHTSTGFQAVAQSYSGDVAVTMFVRDDKDWVRIGVTEHGNTWGGGFILYEGPVERLSNQSRRKILLQALANEMLTDVAA